MRRLYSTFAGGWPGLGLLIMRLVVGCVLVVYAALNIWPDASLHVMIRCAALAVCGGLLIAGLWTPIAGAVAAIIGISMVVMIADHPVATLLAATNAGALALLGPGRWSIDARLFGWRQVQPAARGDRSIAR